MISPYFFAITLFLVGILFRYAVRRLHAHSINHLPGPPPGSWLVGNLPALFRPKSIGDAEFEWTNIFGTAIRIKDGLESDLLFISDPKSFQYILNTAGYNFPKPPEIKAIVGLITGKGLTWAEGAQHARHRKIMNPAFSYTSLRVFLPLFRHTAQRTVSKWRDLFDQTNASQVVDIPGWLARTTLDAIGSAAFDYSFKAIDEGTSNELSRAYSNLFVDAFLERSDREILFERLRAFFPTWLQEVLLYLPTRQLRRLRNYMRVARRVARSLMDRQLKAHDLGGNGGKDVMSILVRANLSEDPKRKLGEDEILSQMTTLMLAGHETTASTIVWALYELSKHPEYQRGVREEIKATRSRAAQRGDEELSVADLDGMELLLALMKETLRYHPIVSTLSRVAGRDDVIPLAAPQRTRSGKMITGIPVSKGQRVIMSIAAYNRLHSVWGDDADAWKPERFFKGMERTQKTGLGVIANIATFSSGIRSCIGWRFAIIEMQAILIELIESFEFSPPPGGIEIIRGASGLMVPLVKGSKKHRTELPLIVTPVI